MIPWFKPQYWGNEKRYVMDALDSNWISNGSYVRKFESVFSAIHHARPSVTVSNGTTALYLALLTLGIGQDDEVIVPGYTFAAPVNMVIASGATPVFCDIETDTWLIDPDGIENKITSRTKAIIAVHIYGNVCAMEKINAIAKKHNLYVIEDVAEAAFSKQDNTYAGALGDIGCFSFQATKTLTMGEGGAVVFSDQELAKKASIIRNHGMTAERPYWHLEIGHNFRLTNMQAAFGFAQLEHLDEIISQKKRVYLRYQEELAGIDGVKLQNFRSNTDPLVWAVAVFICPGVYSVTRDDLRQFLCEQGIETRGGFYPFDEMPLYPAEKLPISQRISHNLISFPSFPGLENEQIDQICKTFKKRIRFYV